MAFANHSCELIKNLDHGSLVDKSLIDIASKELRIIRDTSMNELSLYEEQSLMSKFLFEICKVPVANLTRTSQKGVKFFLTNGAITAHPKMKELYESNEKPRNHTHSTWEELPGAYDPNSKNVIINIASLENGHGSKNLILHEYAHALDYVHSSSLFSTNKKLSNSRDFKNSIQNTPWRKIYQRNQYKDINDIPANFNWSEEGRKVWRESAIEYNKFIDNSTDQLAEYAKANSEEHFAELYTMYFENQENKAKLQKLMPLAAEYFSSLSKNFSNGNTTDKKPNKFKRFLNDLKDKVGNLKDKVEEVL